MQVINTTSNFTFARGEEVVSYLLNINQVAASLVDCLLALHLVFKFGGQAHIYQRLDMARVAFQRGLISFDHWFNQAFGFTEAKVAEWVGFQNPESIFLFVEIVAFVKPHDWNMDDREH